MRQAHRYLAPLFLAVALMAPIANTGCAARVRVYDPYHSDYHHWDDDEDRAYRQYLGERHEGYRGFSKLNHDEQHEYWNWRHQHRDADRR